LPVFYSNLTGLTKHQIQAMFRKAKRWHLIYAEYNLDVLEDKFLFKFFQLSKSETYPLNHLYAFDDTERLTTFRK
jgi:hypothetical protein